MVVLKKTPTYQTNQHAINPTQNVWPIIRFSSVHHHARHQHRSRFLIEPGADVMQIGGRIRPAVCKKSKQLIHQSINTQQ